MNLLIDTCVWHGVCTNLLSAGHNVIWVGDWPEDPGDEDILLAAYQESRILVTLDKDFGDLVIVRGSCHCGILRLVNLARTQQLNVCVYVLGRYGNELESGAIVTAYSDRVRIRH